MMYPRSIMSLMLLLATSAAGAVQPDRCEGDCKGARAQVLLQTGVVGRHTFSARGSGEEFKDVQRVASMSLSDQSALVEDLVTEMLATGQPLTGTQKEIIERLNETFVTETLPELQKRHDSDQELLNVHAAAFAHCDVDLETNSQRVSTLNSDQSSTESVHTECLAQEGSLQSSEKLKHEELTAYLKSLQPPSSMMPEQRAPTPTMDDFAAQNLEFFKSLNSSYVSLKEQISTVEAEVEPRQLAAQRQGWSLTRSFASGSRRADLVAVLKVQCYLKMLLDGTTQEKLKECKDAEHTSSAFDIAEPQLIELNQRVLDGLGAPGSRVQCTAAGSSDAGSLYGTYAADADPLLASRSNWLWRPATILVTCEIITHVAMPVIQLFMDLLPKRRLVPRQVTLIPWFLLGIGPPEDLEPLQATECSRIQETEDNMVNLQDYRTQQAAKKSPYGPNGRRSTL
ncbi:unnamed protein product, partial [Polarella glacialis]